MLLQTFGINLWSYVASKSRRLSVVQHHPWKPVWDLLPCWSGLQGVQLMVQCYSRLVLFILSFCSSVLTDLGFLFLLFCQAPLLMTSQVIVSSPNLYLSYINLMIAWRLLWSLWRHRSMMTSAAVCTMLWGGDYGFLGLETCSLSVVTEKNKERKRETLLKKPCQSWVFITVGWWSGQFPNCSLWLIQMKHCKLNITVWSHRVSDDSHSEENTIANPECSLHIIHHGC